MLGLLLQRHALASAAASQREADRADFEVSTNPRAALLAAPALHPDALDDPTLRSMRLACGDGRRNVDAIITCACQAAETCFGRCVPHVVA